MTRDSTTKALNLSDATIAPEPERGAAYIRAVPSPRKDPTAMPTALDALLAHWEKSRTSPGPGAGSDARTLSVKVSPKTFEDLGQLAKDLQISRTQLLSLIVHDGYDRILRKQKRIERQRSDTGDAAAAETAKPDAP